MARVIVETRTAIGDVESILLTGSFGRGEGGMTRRSDGRLVPAVGETYALSEVRRLHEDLQGRRTRGKLLVDPRR